MLIVPGLHGDRGCGSGDIPPGGDQLGLTGKGQPFVFIARTTKTSIVSGYGATNNFPLSLQVQFT